jgi:hypothetical protein
LVTDCLQHSHHCVGQGASEASSLTYLNEVPYQDSKVQDVYDHVGRTRSTIRGLIKYLIAFEQDQRKKGTPRR